MFYVASGVYQPYNGALTLSPIDTWSHVPNPCKTNTLNQLYYPHPHDTAKFIQCTADGEMYIIQCPEGKEYNPSVTQCALPVTTTVRTIFYLIVTVCIILYHCHHIYRSFTIIVQLYHANKHSFYHITRIAYSHNTQHHSHSMYHSISLSWYIQVLTFHNYRTTVSCPQAQSTAYPQYLSWYHSHSTYHCITVIS